jgi:uncharacterized protein DUF5317
MKFKNIRIPYLYLLAAPALLWFFGYMLNAVAIGCNGGFMPVQGWTECVGHAAEERGDTMHTCMTPQTHLKILCDWVYSPAGTASIGDGFEVAGEYSLYPCLFLWLGFVVRDYSDEEDDESWDS